VNGTGGASTAIVCEPNAFTTITFNEQHVGAGCNPRAPELATCGENYFCTARLLDRWPRLSQPSSPPIIDSGHCTKHCDSDSDCGSGHRCCEAQAAGAFCMTLADWPPTAGCSEPCATNHLDCNEAEQFCCERLGRICVSEHCSGVCLD
jgi:hypothetical protein